MGWRRRRSLQDLCGCGTRQTSFRSLLEEKWLLIMTIRNRLEPRPQGWLEKAMGKLEGLADIKKRPTYSLSVCLILNCHIYSTIQKDGIVRILRPVDTQAERHFPSSPNRSRPPPPQLWKMPPATRMHRRASLQSRGNYFLFLDCVATGVICSVTKVIPGKCP